MFEEMQKALQKPTQDMKKMRVQARLDKFGSIHFRITQINSNCNIELEWNKFVGKEITPEIVKQELEKIRKAMK